MTQVIRKDASDLVCVMLEVHIWSGRRHLDRDDLIAANPALSKLPSEKLATLGAYKICDPDHIKQFQHVKGKAERYLKRAGLPVLGAYGVPASKYPEVHKQLSTFEAEFRTLANHFTAMYDTAVQKWASEQLIENPAYSHLFHHVPTREHVESKLGFAFHPYRISAPAGEGEGDDSELLNDRFRHQVGGLKGELLKEVAKEASTLVDEYMYKADAKGVVKKREYITHRTLGPLKRAAKKLCDFAFLDSTIGPLADMVLEVVDSTVDERIEGGALMRICALSTLLSDPNRAVQVAAAAAQGTLVDDLLSSMNVVRAEPHARVERTTVPEGASVIAPPVADQGATAAEATVALLPDQPVTTNLALLL